MKRRDFLASAAALSLFVSDAWASKKKPAEKSSSKAKPSSAKSTKTTKAKPGQKPGRSAHSSSRVAAPPPGPVVHTADDPVTEKVPQGTSASRLPPVKAPEPPSEWRTYEIVTTVNLKNSGHNRLWLPLPLNQDMLFQRTLGHSWEGNPGSSSMRRLPDGDLEVFHSEWRDGNDGKLVLKTLVTTADRHFDVTKRTVAPER